MTTERYPRVEIHDEKIDEFGRYFLCVTIRKLDEILAFSNISADERRRICGLFTDSFALFLDNGWLDNGQEKLWPLLAFAEREGDSAASVGEIKRLVIPDRQSCHSAGGSEGAVTFHFDNDAEAQEWIRFKSGLRGE